MDNSTLTVQIAQKELSAVTLRFLDHVDDVLCRSFVEKCGEPNCLVCAVERISCFEFRDYGGECRLEGVRYGSHDDNAFRGHADLTGM